MKKYIPEKMIMQNRFKDFYGEWSERDRLRLCEKMSELIAENSDYADDKNFGHLCNLITALAMVLVLEEGGMVRSEAEKAVGDAMYTFFAPTKASMEKLASHGWFVKMLKLTMPIKFAHTLGFGWDVEFPKCPGDRFTMITHKYIYRQLFDKYGMPEMTAVFCEVDDLMYSTLPRAEFIYTEQIGRGESMCDYTFKKR